MTEIGLCKHLTWCLNPARFRPNLSYSGFCLERQQTSYFPTSEKLDRGPPEFKGKLVIDVPHQEWCGVFVLLTSQFLNALNIPYSSLNFCLVVNVFEDTERMEWNAISLKENLLGLKKRRL